MFGGETGAVVGTLIDREDLVVRGVETESPNLAYVHDRRSGERKLVAEMPTTVLSRHDVDELYGAALVEGLAADLCILGARRGPMCSPPRSIAAWRPTCVRTARPWSPTSPAIRLPRCWRVRNCQARPAQTRRRSAGW